MKKKVKDEILGKINKIYSFTTFLTTTPLNRFAKNFYFITRPFIKSTN